MIKKTILILLCAGTLYLSAQNNTPKREVRASWIATVANLDWPSSRYATTQTQKNELISILDDLEQTGINMVVFQIRTECDALYDSPYDPWSYWLTGSQGSAPSPYYDPLQFACEEAHKRNIEIHAWFNPYRAEKTVGSYSIDPSHVTVQHPDWDLQIGNFKFLNPGLPLVREYVAKVITDVVKRYEIDGVHFDDYFYPYPPNNITNEDDSTFAIHNRGIMDRGDWRRDNVNLLVETIYDSINYYKPWVKFGISPFGIWKNNVPPGIVGTSSYNDIYCDPIAWLNGQYIDYVNPQLYWQITGPQDYSLLMPWWGSVSNNRHIYTGHALYKMSGSWNWPSSEIANQIRLNRQEANIQGSVFFRTDHILWNTKGIADTLVNNLYYYPALSPTMTWKDSILPNSPQSLIALGMGQGVELQWSAPGTAIDGDTAKWYVVYRFLVQDSIDIEDPQYIESILNTNSLNYLDNSAVVNESYTYLVTSLDKLQNESVPSNQANIIYTGLDLFASDQPVQFKLEQNYPNPFNSITNIQFSIPKSEFITLKIYNMLGQEVATVVSDQLSPGNYKHTWDASDFASGIYLYKLETSDPSTSSGHRFIQSKKLILLK
jgi:uncharacterized lipoprotein YddW (UPF0748 family)